jgi:hypothetical protein
MARTQQTANLPRLEKARQINRTHHTVSAIRIQR